MSLLPVICAATDNQTTTTRNTDWSGTETHLYTHHAPLIRWQHNTLQSSGWHTRANTLLAVLYSIRLVRLRDIASTTLRSGYCAPTSTQPFIHPESVDEWITDVRAYSEDMFGSVLISLPMPAQDLRNGLVRWCLTALSAQIDCIVP